MKKERYDYEIKFRRGIDGAGRKFMDFEPVLKVA
jgi:hypothetical protein